ncbi:Ribosomal protein L11 methyltransferase [Candidatus Hepatincola sp. Pdp]
MKYLSILIKEANLTNFENAFEEFGTIIVSGLKGFEKPSVNILDLSFSKWQIQFIPYELSKINFIKELILSKQTELGYKVLAIKVKNINNLPQVNELNQEIDLQIGNMRISNKLTKLANPKNINIFMEQSLGFGTGKHETTFLCLQVLNQLAQSAKLKKILDLGTGSGILAIAAAKLWQTEVLAVDIDELALNTAKQFIKLNQVDNLVTSLCSTGFQNIPPQQFSLIIANILLNPLLAMVDDFNTYTAREGYLILSGILNSQSSMLKKAFSKWQVLKELKENGWSTLLLQR